MLRTVDAVGATLSRKASILQLIFARWQVMSYIFRLKSDVKYTSDVAFTQNSFCREAVNQSILASEMCDDRAARTSDDIVGQASACPLLVLRTTTIAPVKALTLPNPPLWPQHRGPACQQPCYVTVVSSEYSVLHYYLVGTPYIVT